MRTQIIAELASGHGGDVELAKDMIAAAAEAGCDGVKIQHYGQVRRGDPQAAWLEQSRLRLGEIRRLADYAGGYGVRFIATPFDGGAASDLVACGVTDLKLASSHVLLPWVNAYLEHVCVVSWPWGMMPDGARSAFKPGTVHLTAIPLYPTPPECVYRAPLLDGWSDHGEGMAACYYAISHGAQMLEVHLTLLGTKARVMSFDKTPAMLKDLRQYADAVATMTTGVSQHFRERFIA